MCRCRSSFFHTSWQHHQFYLLFEFFLILLSISIDLSFGWWYFFFLDCCYRSMYNNSPYTLCNWLRHSPLKIVGSLWIWIEPVHKVFISQVSIPFRLYVLPKWILGIVISINNWGRGVNCVLGLFSDFLNFLNLLPDLVINFHWFFDQSSSPFVFFHFIHLEFTRDDLFLGRWTSSSFAGWVIFWLYGPFRRAVEF